MESRVVMAGLTNTWVDALYHKKMRSMYGVKAVFLPERTEYVSANHATNCGRKKLKMTLIAIIDSLSLSPVGS